MKRILVLLVIGTLLALPIASADSPSPSGHNSENDLRFTQFPQVYVNATNSASFNVSFLGLILLTQSGTYMSYFPNENWNVDVISNNSLYYSSDVHFVPMDKGVLRNLEQRFNISNVQSPNPQQDDQVQSAAAISASVNISLNKTYVNDPLANASRKELSSFQITFSLSSSQITGPGDLLLVQQLGARIDSAYEQFHDLEGLSNSVARTNDTGVGMNASSYEAYYWWNSNYTMNGKPANLTSIIGSTGSVDTIIFKYSFTNGLHSMTQDPYFSVPQVNLFQNPIVQQDIINAARFLIVHVELLAGGIATGAILLGISYGAFRRRRF